MLSINENLWLKIVAWFLQFPLYIYWIVVKFFLNKGPNEWDTIQAPQQPRTIVVTGASQGSLIAKRIDRQNTDYSV